MTKTTPDNRQNAYIGDTNSYEYENQLVTYLTRRLLWAADHEPGLMEAHAIHSARCREFLGKGKFETIRDWDGLVERVTHELRRTSDLYARLIHALFFAILVPLAAICETGFDQFNGFGFVGALIAIIIFIATSPQVSRFITWRGQCLALKLAGAYDAPQAPRYFATISSAQWFREPAIRLVTPSFLVAMVGLLGATVAIGHSLNEQLHEAQAELTHKSPQVDALIADAVRSHSWFHSARVLLWLLAGRGELALSALLALAAFLIESVLENLSVTREALGIALTTARSLADRSNEAITGVDKFLAGLKDAKNINESAEKIRQFEDVLTRASSLRLDAELLLKTYPGEALRLDKRRIGLAKYTASQHVVRFVDVVAGYFKTLGSMLNTKLSDTGTDREIFYQLTVILNSFRAAMQSQNQLLSLAADNGQHFDIIAPFEALALTASGFIETILARSPEIAQVSRGRTIRYYTVLPIRPSDFFSRVRWTNAAPDGSTIAPRAMIPADEKSRAWLEFLKQCRLAKTVREGGGHTPEVIRHFIQVDERLISTIQKRYLQQFARRDAFTDGIFAQDDFDGDYEQYDQRRGRPDLRWNPLGLETERFLLRAGEIALELKQSYLKPLDSEGSYSSTLDDDRPIWDLKNRGDYWTVHVSKENSKFASSVPLYKALERYHLVKRPVDRGSGLRFIQINGNDWDETGDDCGPARGSPLAYLLDPKDGEWIWVDYFAAAIHDDTELNESALSQEWLYVVKSYFNAELGAVHMHLHFMGQTDWADEAAKLDIIFGTNGRPADHVKYLDFNSGDIVPFT